MRRVARLASRSRKPQAQSARSAKFTATKAAAHLLKGNAGRLLSSLRLSAARLERAFDDERARRAQAIRFPQAEGEDQDREDLAVDDEEHGLDERDHSAIGVAIA